jgi:hypothetical protein
MLATRGRKSSKGSSSGTYLSEKAKSAFGDSGRALSIAFGGIVRKSSVSISGRYGRASSVAVSGKGADSERRASYLAEPSERSRKASFSAAVSQSGNRLDDADDCEGAGTEAAAREDSKAFEA